MKHISIVVTVVLVFIALSLAGVAIRFNKDKTATADTSLIEAQVSVDSIPLVNRAFSELDLPIRPVQIGTEEFSLVVAKSGQERVAGLSGVTSMRYYDGMLFDFGQSAKHGFWMKEMRFALDIIWLDALGKVVHIEERLSPDTYPRVFTPEVAASYVIELNAGVVRDTNIKIGDTINIKGTEVAAPGE